MEIGGIVLLELAGRGVGLRRKRVCLKLSKQIFNLLLVVLVDYHRRRIGLLLLLCLDLDVSGHEGRRRHFPGQFHSLRSVFFQGDVENGSVDVCCSLYELSVDGVVEVQFQSIRHSFKPAPERLSCVFNDMVGGEGVEKLLDLVVEHILEYPHSKLNANLVALLRVSLVQFFKGLQLSPQSGGVLPVLLLKLRQKLLPILEETDQLRRSLTEGPLEVVPSPLDGVLDLIGEVLERAKRDALLGGVHNVSVANGRLGDDDLRVALGPQCPALEEGLFEPDALAVHVLPRLDVVDRIDHKIQIGPEIIIEDRLILRGDPQLQGLEIDLRVDTLSDRAGSLALVLADMLLPEQKLPVEIADLDVVVISDRQLPLAGAQTHQREHFDKLAPQRTGADHKRGRF